MQEVLFMFGTSRENAVKVFDEIRAVCVATALRSCTYPKKGQQQFNSFSVQPDRKSVV